MRIRTIKPEFFLHDGLYELESESKLPIRIAFAGLWCVADREGRFRWEPKRIGVQVLPYDNVEFSRVLDALATRGFVRKYSVDSVEYGWIPSFTRHQVINNRERDSELPDPTDSNICDACPTRAPRVHHAGKAEGKGREGKGREGKGREGNKEHGREGESHSIPFDSEEFAEAWKDWKNHRDEIKKRLTPTSIAAQLRGFEKWGEPRSIRAIYHTIRKGWQGLAEPEPRDMIQSPPSFSEVESFGHSNSQPDSAITEFFDRMQRCGWYDRSGPIIDWMAAMRYSCEKWHEFNNRNHK